MRPDPADLAAVLAGLGDLGFDIALDPAPGRGWARLDQYASDAGILDAGLRLAGTRFGLPEPSAMTGGWLVGDVAAAVAWPAVAALLTRGSVLVTDIRDVHLPHPASGRRRAGRISAPHPPRPGTAEGMAAGIVKTLDPVVEAVHQRTRRGRHALWGTVTDMVAAAFHRVGDHLDRSDDARRLADAVIDDCAALVGGSNWHDVTWSGGTEHTRIRNICCLWYRTPERGLCLTCPRITDRDRTVMLCHRAETV